MQASIQVYETHWQAAFAAASAVAAEIRRLIAERGRAIGIFSGEASQREFLDALAGDESIEWTRVIVFHTAELLGADENSPQSHRKLLLDHLVRRVPLAEFHGIRGEAANPEAVCANYAALLKTRPPDFAVLGIGESGELAAIDSRACDLNDQASVRLVDSAISLTPPALMACPALFVTASGKSIREAVRLAIEDEISESCPASILQTHPNAHLFLDSEAAAGLSLI
ncbi:MAG: 6-phosphogluconolactonase [Acidobacteriota bacterium]